MVLGVRVHGADVVDCEVKLDETFRSVPIPEKLGIPVLYKLQSGTGGDDSAIRKNAIVSFMSDTSDGLAPDEWQYGGKRGPAPPVVLARKDLVPFSKDDFQAICEYRDLWMEEAREDEHFTKATERILEPLAFQRFLRERFEDFPRAFLSLRYPKGSLVMAENLQNVELNGQKGTVAQYSRDRVGVVFGSKLVALRPERLRILEEVEPARKRHVGAKQTEERRRELERQEAMAIAKRFHECMFEDTFPEMGELHLFGLGGEYKARATDVLAVWQGLVKNLHFEASRIAEALIAGNMKERFEGWTRELAESKTPNSTYAKNLIEARFAATEWDEL